jgi:hypothetical protein
MRVRRPRLERRRAIGVIGCLTRRASRSAACSQREHWPRVQLSEHILPLIALQIASMFEHPNIAQPAAPGGQYETWRQAHADVAEVYEQSRRSSRRGVMGEANLARLRDGCERAGVTLGALDDRVLAWLAGYEPETCAAGRSSGPCQPSHGRVPLMRFARPAHLLDRLTLQPVHAD